MAIVRYALCSRSEIRYNNTINLATRVDVESSRGLDNDTVCSGHQISLRLTRHLYVESSASGLIKNRA